MTATEERDWKGSDLRSRAEIVRYLDRRGGTITDEGGLVVTTMRSELNRGRALSQLLQEMERDGMIEREIRGRRTFMVKLVDDWGLIPRGIETGLPNPLPPVAAPIVPVVEQDYDQLAAALLAIVVKRASTPPEQVKPDPVLTRRLTQAEAQLTEALDRTGELERELVAAQQVNAELRAQVDRLQANLDILSERLQSQHDGTPVADRLSDEDRAVLAQLGGQLAAPRRKTRNR